MSGSLGGWTAADITLPGTEPTLADFDHRRHWFVVDSGSTSRRERRTRTRSEGRPPTCRPQGVQMELVDRARRGDREAFGVLAASAVNRLYATARLILRDAELAEDATQD